MFQFIVLIYSVSQKGIGSKLMHSLSQEVLGNGTGMYVLHVQIHHHHFVTGKQIKRTHSTGSYMSEESGSLDSFNTSSHLINDILSEVFGAETTSTANHVFSWKVKNEVHLQDKVIQLVKTSWFDLASRYILNRGYRIIVTLPCQQTRILAQEKCNPEGKKQIQNRWEQTIRVLNETHVVLKQPNCITETGHFQDNTIMVEMAEVHDLSLPHYQNIYYGTVNLPGILHPNNTKTEETLYTGVAQCTISPTLLKEMYSILSKTGFRLKMWHGPASDTNISINYLSEIEQEEFKKTLDESIFDSKSRPSFQNSEIVLYIPNSSKSFNKNLVQTSQLAVDLGFSGNMVLFEWYTETESNSTDQVTEKAKPRLLQFLTMLCSRASKVHVIAVHDGALLLVKALNGFELTLGQVIFTRLHSLSSRILNILQGMKDNSDAILYQVDNITIYYKPKSCNSLIFPLRSFSVGSAQDMIPKKVMLNPPHSIPNVDIIYLGTHRDRSLIKNREYAVNKVVIEDMSEIISLGKGIKDRPYRIRIQCGCKDLKLPTELSSHIQCKMCKCYCYFVLGRVIGLGNLKPEEMQQYHEHSDTDETKRCLSIHQLPTHQSRRITTKW